MFERIQNDGVVPKTSTVGAPARAELVVAPAPVSSELREQAVTPTVAGQRSTTDNDPMHPLMAVIGQIREEMDGQVRNQAEDKRLQELYAKLFKAYGRVASGQPSDVPESDIDRTLEQLDAAYMPKSESGDAPQVLRDENAAAQALRQQRERMMEKIAMAMRKVGVLRNKLSEDGEQSHDRLVNINTSLASLNMARTQLDDSSFAITSAASTVDSVMLNLRSAVFAHGKISADLVRLVMS